MYIRYLLIDSFIYPTCNSVAKLQDVLLINLLTYLIISITKKYDTYLYGHRLKLHRRRDGRGV